MLGLDRGGGRVPFVCGGLFRGCRASGNSTISAVIADVVCGVADYGFVVNVVNVGDVYVIHRAVVVEGSVIPISTAVAGTTIAVAVIYAAIETDLSAPVAFIPGIRVVAPAPVAGSPKQTGFGGHYPRAWHPKVAIIPIRPVAGRPQITVGRGHRLLVYGQCGGSERDGNAELRE